MKCIFVVKKKSTKKQKTYEAKPNLDKNIAIDFHMLKNKSISNYRADHKKSWVENYYDDEFIIVESL